MQLPENRLNDMESRFEQIEARLAEPEVAARPDELRELGKEHAELREIVEMWRERRTVAGDLSEATAMLTEARGGERDYVQGEIASLKSRLEDLDARLSKEMTPKDANDDRDVIMEIRAGAGGDEAGLFAGDLVRMYGRYAENKRWKTEELSSNPTGVGGFKDVSVAVKGKGAYSRLKFEAGVHRVQRVPVTESSGRIHTSAVAVNVLPEAEEVDVDIDPNDLKIDVYRSSGPGGQSVNTTDSAVRIRHLPTGIEVACQDEKSQLQNRVKALRILRARLLQAKQEEQARELAAERRSQVRSADRSERIRTYNFHENRVSDHRIGYTVHRLSQILEGDLDDLIDALTAGLQGPE
ncbi:peptide chain release factor 1 [soil metagenome]|jgi:peptide chain release factor 1|nr:peptide chain release factor 1 [Actinomycetota bacterium]MDQ3218072.1 peptide chain release factor 1 [Actinomycetota bacterium]